MANFQLSPPESFNFSSPKDWPRWIRWYERFRQASDLHRKSNESQVNNFIYSMGDQADDILRSFGLSEEEMKNYTIVKGKFEGHFVKRRNTVYERAKFNQRKQEDGGTVDSFITALYCLVEHCQYGDLANEMIRDRIVAGVRDAYLPEKMQLDAELTLEKAVALAQQTEVIRQQQIVARGITRDKGKIDAVKSEIRHRQEYAKNFEVTHSSMQRPPGGVCSRCGRRPPHSKFRCPAKNAKCHECSKKGHYQSMCRSKASISSVQEQSEDESVFLGAVHSQPEASSKPWNVMLQMNGCPVEFKIDSGADITVVLTELYQPNRDGALLKPKKLLKGPNQVSLSVRGCFTASLEKDDLKSEEQIYVVDGLSKPLVGKPAIVSLKLLSTLQALSVEESIPHQYPELFKGLGRLSGRYTIRLKNRVTPFALSSPQESSSSTSA